MLKNLKRWFLRKMMDEPTLRLHVQRLTKKLLPQFSKVTDPTERIKLIFQEPELEELNGTKFQESLKSGWPRKNEELGSTNREDGNSAFQKGNHEMAVLLYTEAMKYSPVHETLWEGETMAIAAANRYYSFKHKP